jgi:hypothetical protein
MMVGSVSARHGTGAALAAILDQHADQSGVSLAD